MSYSKIIKGFNLNCEKVFESIAVAEGCYSECADLGISCISRIRLNGPNSELSEIILDNTISILTSMIDESYGEALVSLNGALLVAKAFGKPARMVSLEELRQRNGIGLNIIQDSHKEKAEKENIKEKEKTKEESITPKDTDDIGEVEKTDAATNKYLSFINNKVDELLDSYRALYEVCYKNSRPKGILTPEGIWTLSGNESKLKQLDEDSTAELGMVYSVIESCLGKIDCTTRFNSYVSPTSIDDYTGVPMLIKYHLANMYGYFGSRSSKSTSYKEFETYIKDRTKNILYKIIQGLTEDQKSNRDYVSSIILKYISIIKTCILVDDYVPGVVLKLRICVDSSVYPNESQALCVGAFRNVINEGFLFKTKTSVESPSSNNPNGKLNDVLYINFVIDAQTYYNAPLFAYEALPILKEQGIKLSWDNILIGKDVKDELVFGKFGAQQKTIYNILAGSGSGKGVMTLSLLASALASNIPVMYADCKPDMASVLWNVAEGDNVLAFDGDASGILSPVETRFDIYQYMYKTLPTPVLEFLKEKGYEKMFVKTYCYLRNIHLAYFISLMRKEQGVSPDDYILFIFDEIGRLAEQVQLLTVAFKGDNGEGGFVADRTKLLKSNPETKNTVTTDESIKYARNFVAYAIGVMDKIVTAKTAELRLSNSKLLFIWQPDWLKKASLDAIRSKDNKYYFMSVLYKLVSDSNTVKFAGKGAESSGVIGMGEAYNSSATNKQLFDEFRYFALAESGEVSTTSKIFRPFLLLNDCSATSAAKCVGTNPLAYDKVYRNGNESDIIPEIGFPEYVNKLLGGNIKEPLCRSWGIALDAIESLGYERDLYKFMYDVSDVRLNLTDSKQLNSTEDIPQEEKDIRDLLKDSSEDFSNGDCISDSEESRLEGVFREDDEFDLFDDASFNATDYSELENNSQYNENLREIQELISRLNQLGVSVSMTPDENISRLDSRVVFSEPQFIGNSFDYSEVSLQQLVDMLTSSVIKEFGGLDRFMSFRVKGGCIAINDSYYRCQISDACKSSVPYDIRREINAGNISSLFDYRYLRSMPNLRILNIDSKDLFVNYIAPAIGISSINEIFDVLKNLTSVKIGDKVCTREEYKELEKELEMTRRANSLAASVEKYCFKGTGATWSFTKNMWNKKNCNKLAKALGVTAGVTGTVATGAAGVGVKVGRAVVHTGKSFIKGLKDLF